MVSRLIVRPPGISTATRHDARARGYLRTSAEWPLIQLSFYPEARAAEDSANGGSDGPQVCYTAGQFTHTGAYMFQSVEDVQQHFKNARYIANRRISTVVFLRERIGQLIADADSLPEAVAKISGQDDAFFSHRFLAPRPLLQAIESVEPVVLLVDEIDKAEPEFEAFLLEVLSDFQVSVPELGTIKATNIPLVVLTSNNARELSDGLKRRCLHLFIDFPPPDEELAIIRLKVPEVSERLAQTVVAAVQRIRGLELRKAPSVSESLDWARSLVILNAESLDRELVESTLTMLVKHEKDLERVKGALDKVLADLD